MYMHTHIIIMASMFLYSCLLSPGLLQVYEATRAAAKWSELIAPGQTFAVDSRLWSCTDLTSTRLVGGWTLSSTMFIPLFLRNCGLMPA